MTMTIHFQFPKYLTRDYSRFSRYAPTDGEAYKQTTIEAASAAFGLTKSGVVLCANKETRVICRPDQMGVYMALRMAKGQGMTGRVNQEMDIKFIQSEAIPSYRELPLHSLFSDASLNAPDANDLVACPGIAMLPPHVMLMLVDHLGPKFDKQIFYDHPKALLVMTRDEFMRIALALNYPLVVKPYRYEAPNILDVRENSILYPKEMIS